MFTLAITRLMTPNLPWFMDLTLQVPMQYSLQSQTLLTSPVKSTTWCSFCFGSDSSFFTELFLYSSPVTYWAPTDLGSSFFRVICFHLFILFVGFSRQEYWSGLPFPSPVDHILSELSSMTCPSWVAPHSMAHRFIELDKAVIQLISLVCLCLVTQPLCDHVDYSPPGSSVHENAPDKNTRVGYQALLQGIFPTQGLNPGLLHCRQFLYYLSYQGSPTILERVAFFFSRGSS